MSDGHDRASGHPGHHHQVLQLLRPSATEDRAVSVCSLPQGTPHFSLQLLYLLLGSCYDAPQAQA